MTSSCPRESNADLTPTGSTRQRGNPSVCTTPQMSLGTAVPECQDFKGTLTTGHADGRAAEVELLYMLDYKVCRDTFFKKAQLCSPWVPDSQYWDLFFQQTFGILSSSIQQNHNHQESLRIKLQHIRLHIIQLC